MKHRGLCGARSFPGSLDKLRVSSLASSLESCQSHPNPDNRPTSGPCLKAARGLSPLGGFPSFNSGECGLFRGAEKSATQLNCPVSWRQCLSQRSKSFSVRRHIYHDSIFYFFGSFFIISQYFRPRARHSTDITSPEDP
jgi:hypothetical protein